jgi:hypothetical protein
MLANRRSVPTAARDKKPSSTEILGRYCWCAPILHRFVFCTNRFVHAVMLSQLV